jgi:glycosyltransferase involved in cell wall biosynthesis
VGQFRSFLAAADSIRLLFVDDGSRDRTRDVASEICRGYEDRATVLSLPENKGKAEAVRAGMVYALEKFQPEVVGFWDADLATPLDAVPRLLKVLQEEPAIEMVFGSRVQLLGRHVERLPARHYLGRVFATAVSVVLKMPIYDSQCGAKLFRADGNCRAVFAQPFFSKWVFDVEILARYLNVYDHDAKRLQQAIYEYPLEKWVDVAGSKVRPTDFVRAFSDIAKIKRKYL